LLDLAHLTPAGKRDVDTGFQLRLGERLDQVAHHARFHRAVDELAVGIGREQQHRRDALLGQAARRGDAIQLGHLDVHDHEIRAGLAG
jgi:hypothetical protein